MAAGLQQYDLAAAIRVSQPTIARYEKGVGEVPDTRKRALAIELNCSIAYLMGWSDERGEPPAQPKRKRAVSTA